MANHTRRCVACGVALEFEPTVFCERCWQKRILTTIDAAVERAASTFGSPERDPSEERRAEPGGD